MAKELSKSVQAGLRGLERLQSSGSSEESARIYCETMENMERVNRGEEIEVQQPQQGIAVSEELAIQVLSDSLSYRFKEEARTRFPTLYEYFEMQGEDVDNSFVRRLRNEFALVGELVNGDLELRVAQGQDYVAVATFEGTGSLSPHAPLVARAIIKRKVEYNAKSKLKGVIDEALAMCDEAVRRNCGFGKYSREE